MRIKLHDDVEGHKSGETVDVPEERAKWYLANGYASAASYNRDEDPVAGGVLAKNDPTLASNRSDEPNKTLPEVVAERDGWASAVSEDADDFAPTPRAERAPIEATNGKGDPEKAAKGKAALEEKADATDATDAPESNPDLVEQRSDAADTSEEGARKADAAGDKAEAKEDGLAAATATTDSPTDPAQKAATKARGNKG
jgi:hypothetical protein